jgi:hypothetical protein
MASDVPFSLIDVLCEDSLSPHQTLKLHNFRQSPLYKILIKESVSLEELVRVEKLVTVTDFVLYDVNGVNSVIELSIKSQLDKNNVILNTIDIDRKAIYHNDLSPVKNINLQCISDVYKGRTAFPGDPSKKPQTIFCMSIGCVKHQHDLHLLSESQEIRDQWVDGLYTILKCFNKVNIEYLKK